MQLGMWFWIIWVFFAIFGGLWAYPPTERWGRGGFTVVLWVLLALLGFKVFGGPVQ